MTETPSRGTTSRSYGAGASGVPYQSERPSCEKFTRGCSSFVFRDRQRLVELAVAQARSERVRDARPIARLERVLFLQLFAALFQRVRDGLDFGRSGVHVLLVQ